MNKSKFLFVILLFSSLSLSLEAQEVNSSISSKNNEATLYSDAELAQMLAPIALYPDSLLTHILIASTYPIEVVEAQRWAEHNVNLNNDELADALELKSWDPSVKALVPFKNVIERLSLDLSWTRTLGDVFLQDEEKLLAIIQQLRFDAKKTGSLDSIENMDVSYEEANIVLTPSKPDIIYVPVYDSRSVYGSWRWYGYPPVYWSYPKAYYSSFYWTKPVYISVNYYFSAFHWHNRHIVTINHRNTRYYRPHHKIVSQGYAKRWNHKPSHRKGVSYANKQQHRKYYGTSGPKYIPKHKSSNKYQSKNTAKNVGAHSEKYTSKHSLKENKKYQKHYAKLNSSNKVNTHKNQQRKKMYTKYDVKSNPSTSKTKKNSSNTRNGELGSRNKSKKQYNVASSNYVASSGKDVKHSPRNKNAKDVKATRHKASFNKPTNDVAKKSTYQQKVSQPKAQKQSNKKQVKQKNTHKADRSTQKNKSANYKSSSKRKMVKSGRTPSVNK